MSRFDFYRVIKAPRGTTRHTVYIPAFSFEVFGISRPLVCDWASSLAPQLALPTLEMS